MSVREQNAETMAYYARHRCGGVVTAVIDSSNHKDDTYKEVARMWRNDPPVRRANVERVRAFRWCKCWSGREHA